MCRAGTHPRHDAESEQHLRADFSYWLLCLEKEALTETEHFKLGLAGGFLKFLSASIMQPLLSLLLLIY